MQYQLKGYQITLLNVMLNLFNVLVRLDADYRINPHAPPFKQTPANLFKFNLCSLTPQARHFSVNVYTKKQYSTYNAHQFIVRTTRVSNPIRYSYLNGSTSIVNGTPPRPSEIPNNLKIFYL